MIGRDEPAPIWLALAATAGALLVGYLLKRQCVVNGWVDDFQYRRLCYNDIQPLFGFRGIDKGLVPYRDVRLEYPVLTGMFMDLAGRAMRALSQLRLVTNDNPGYFRVNAAGLAPFAFAVTMLLRPMVPAKRLLVWAAGTPLVLYAFHNWDLLAVAGAVWGLAAFARRRDGWAGAALALGASAKLYPAFLLPALLLARWSGDSRPGRESGGRAADKRSALRLPAAFVAVYAVVNLPWVFISGGDPVSAGVGSEVPLRQPGTNGWLEVWKFHADRYPDFGTVWYWIAHHGKVLFAGPGWGPGEGAYQSFVSVASFVLFAAGSAWLLWRGWKRRAETGGYPALGVGLGIVALFLLVSKVHSPQYALWVVPFLVLLKVPWRLVFGYLATDLAVYVAGFYFFTVMDQPAPAWKGLFEVAVLARAGALAALVWWSTRPPVPSESAVARSPAPEIPGAAPAEL